jgi:hypothetical protein
MRFSFFCILYFMDVLIQQLEELEEKLDVNKALDFSVDSDIQELIIELNQEQLYNLGEDSEGKSLGTYAPTTVMIKQAQGVPTDRITLKDTGDFYSSFKVFYSNGEIFIDADGQKDDTNLFDEYGEDILGLNDANMSIFIDEVKKNIVFYLFEK